MMSSEQGGEPLFTKTSKAKMSGRAQFKNQALTSRFFDDLRLSVQHSNKRE